jgi:hypothetical protein
MKAFCYFLTCFILLSSLISCTAFMPGRSYLSEMEQDSESSFFKPNRDFPVMAGDNGRYWYTDQERKSRTPASDYEQRRDREADIIRSQREALEAALPEEEQALYTQVQSKFTTDSEKIFFLELPYEERLSYVESRGWGRSLDPLNTAWENRLATRQKEIMMGMTKQEVIESAGRPSKVEVAGNPRYENERWMYSIDGVTKYIYFEAGVVGGWDSGR